MDDQALPAAGTWLQRDHKWLHRIASEIFAEML
jgi:hypothetical protein